MRTSILKASNGFEFNPLQSKNTAKDQAAIIKKALEEAKRQAYADMGI